MGNRIFWSEVADEVTPRKPERDPVERALRFARKRLAEDGEVAWLSLPPGVPEALIDSGEAEQVGVMYLRRKP